jgi:hypothetical protein
MGGVGGTGEGSVGGEEDVVIKEECVKVEEIIKIKEEIPEAIVFPPIKTEHQVGFWLCVRWWQLLCVRW